MALQKYPIGIQTFEKIRTGNYLYIDKTQFIQYMMEEGLNYVFLSRPRRFGKSLFTSTLKAYFEGRRELFKGLALDKWEKDWIKHPVLHFDLSTAKHNTKEELMAELSMKLAGYEEIYGKESIEITLNQRLAGIIKRAYEKSRQRVVVLIDEYDAPLLDVSHNDDNLEQMRLLMRNFYSPLKTCDPYLHFVYITGITKFSQLSIFSELNNLANIGSTERYAAICGITQDELEMQMSEHIDYFAQCTGDTRENVLSELKRHYDGYHFTWPSPDIYNPFSLMNSFWAQKYESYWFASGTPTYLIRMLRKYNAQPSELVDKTVGSRSFDAPIEMGTNYLPLLYQSGYLTIKDGDRKFDEYTLGIPNQEVRIGLMNALLPYYLQLSGNDITDITLELSNLLRKEDIDGALRVLQKFLATVPYCDNANSEGHWQQVMYIIFSLIGARLDVEVRTATGRVDMVLYGKGKIYLFELKLYQGARAAIGQIDRKGYSERFALDSRPVVKVGITFDHEKRTLKEWCIE